MIQILGRINFKLMKPKLQAGKTFVNPTVAKNKDGVPFLTKSPHIDFLREKISFLNQERDLELHQKSFWIGELRWKNEINWLSWNHGFVMHTTSPLGKNHLR